MSHYKFVDGGWVKWDGHAHSYGWHKAADILLEDLYVVWRALEALPVWPSYYAAKLGYEHGGAPVDKVEGYFKNAAPKMLTVEDAKRLVGISSSVLPAAAE
jgi:hypothetical protein